MEDKAKNLIEEMKAQLFRMEHEILLQQVISDSMPSLEMIDRFRFARLDDPESDEPRTNASC